MVNRRVLNHMLDCSKRGYSFCRALTPGAYADEQTFSSKLIEEMLLDIAQCGVSRHHCMFY